MAEKTTKTAAAKAAKKEKSMFEQLNEINVNDHTESKNGLTYLSWAWAWQRFCLEFPDASYKVYRNEQGLPYVYDPNTGYMVYVEVTAGGITHEMWLPVMDSGNNAMKAEGYEIRTKYKTIYVKPATMTDINRALMRALVKCLAIFGLGLYIYASEDLPQVEAEAQKVEQKKEYTQQDAGDIFDAIMPKPTRESLLQRIRVASDAKGISEADICKLSKQNPAALTDMTDDQLQKCLEWLAKQ